MRAGPRFAARSPACRRRWPPTPDSETARSSCRPTARLRCSLWRFGVIRRRGRSRRRSGTSSRIIPAAFRDTDAEVLVGGLTSENIDYFDSVIDPAPIVIAFVLGLTFSTQSSSGRSWSPACRSLSTSRPSAQHSGCSGRVPARSRRWAARVRAGGLDRGPGCRCLSPCCSASRWTTRSSCSADQGAL